MRFHSDPASIQNGEFTILAIAETIFAVVVTCSISMIFESLIPIALSSTFAPLLLLRSKSSEALGLLILRRLTQLIDYRRSLTFLIRNFALVALLLMLPIGFLPVLWETDHVSSSLSELGPGFTILAFAPYAAIVMIYFVPFALIFASKIYATVFCSVRSRI